MNKTLLLISLLATSLAYSQSYEVEEVRLVANIQPIYGINQKSDEFSPLVFGDKLYFTSSRHYNKHSIGEENWGKNAFLNVFYGSINNYEEGTADIRDIRLMSNKLNTGRHTGPISFSKTGDTLYFTKVIQVSERKERIYRPQLFMAVKKKDKWTKISRLSFSKNESAYGHPSFDSAKNRLYFASDRPGGKGGDDIYYSSLQNGEWSEPVNVEAINTSRDEKFPFVIGGNIFFSSNREGGMGQMDIYYNSPEPADYPIKLAGLNSPYDDFGISLLPDLSAGYFSSNRNGNDDILYFTLEKKVTVKNQLAGTFTFRTLSGSASDLSVQLFNEDGEFVYEEKTDKEGHFVFEDVLLDSNFSVRLQGFEQEEMTLDFYNASGEETASFLLSEEGAFKYKKLFYENGGIINFIPDDMKDFELNTALLSGKLVLEDTPGQALPDNVVNLLDENENVIKTTKTDDLGNFEFSGLDLDKSYFIRIPECSDDLLLYVYGSKDNIYTQLKCNSQDEFIYRRLRGDLGNNLSLIKVSEEDIFMLNSSEISGQFIQQGSENGIECVVRVYNDKGILLDVTESNKDGHFSFNNLSDQNTYKFTADSNSDLQLLLFNRYGKQIAKIQEEEDNYFIFRPLGFQTDYDLSLMDDRLRFDLNLSDRYDAVTVYFDSNRENVNASDLEKLNTLLKLLKRYPQLKLSVSAYADATASDEYNFILSQKRGDWILDYFSEKGIEKNRFTVNAYGETKLIDPENDALNRRAELRIYQ